MLERISNVDTKLQHRRIVDERFNHFGIRYPRVLFQIILQVLAFDKKRPIQIHWLRVAYYKIVARTKRYFCDLPQTSGNSLKLVERIECFHLMPNG